ncbi:hypothetical protein Ciccas_011694, partial [Cichlidogyrus casuarinus]
VAVLHPRLKNPNNSKPEEALAGDLWSNSELELANLSASTSLPPIPTYLHSHQL